VTYRFVQQHAGPAGAENDFHLAGGRCLGIKLQDRLARCFFGEVLGSFFSEEKVERYAAAATGTSAAGLLIGLGDAGNIQTSQRLGIFSESALRVTIRMLRSSSE